MVKSVICLPSPLTVKQTNQAQIVEVGEKPLLLGGRCYTTGAKNVGRHRQGVAIRRGSRIQAI
jgi:hypothetical protein